MIVLDRLWEIIKNIFNDIYEIVIILCPFK